MHIKLTNYNHQNGEVEIDDLIAPTISILNRKGYITCYCCSGHSDSIHRPEYAYIQFDDFLRPDEIPDGWSWTSDGSIRYKYDKYPEKLLEAEIENIMNKLLMWAQSLPDGNA